MQISKGSDIQTVDPSSQSGTAADDELSTQAGGAVDGGDDSVSDDGYADNVDSDGDPIGELAAQDEAAVEDGDPWADAGAAEDSYESASPVEKDPYTAKFTGGQASSKASAAATAAAQQAAYTLFVASLQPSVSTTSTGPSHSPSRASSQTKQDTAPLQAARTTGSKPKAGASAGPANGALARNAPGTPAGGAATAQGQKESAGRPSSAKPKSNPGEASQNGEGTQASAGELSAEPQTLEANSTATGEGSTGLEGGLTPRQVQDFQAGKSIFGTPQSDPNAGNAAAKAGTQASRGSEPSSSNPSAPKTAQDKVVEGVVAQDQAQASNPKTTQVAGSQAVASEGTRTDPKKRKLVDKSGKPNSTQALAAAAAGTQVDSALLMCVEEKSYSTLAMQCASRRLCNGGERDPSQSLVEGFALLGYIEKGKAQAMFSRAASGQLNAQAPTAVSMKAPVETKPISFDHAASYLDRLSGSVPGTMQSSSDAHWFVAYSGQFNPDARRLMEEQGIKPDAFVASLNKNQPGNDRLDVPA